MGVTDALTWKEHKKFFALEGEFATFVDLENAFKTNTVYSEISEEARLILPYVKISVLTPETDYASLPQTITDIENILSSDVAAIIDTELVPYEEPLYMDGTVADPDENPMVTSHDLYTFSYYVEGAPADVTVTVGVLLRFDDTEVSDGTARSRIINIEDTESVLKEARNAMILDIDALGEEVTMETSFTEVSQKVMEMFRQMSLLHIASISAIVTIVIVSVYSMWSD